MIVENTITVQSGGIGIINQMLDGTRFSCSGCVNNDHYFYDPEDRRFKYYQKGSEPLTANTADMKSFMDEDETFSIVTEVLIVNNKKYTMESFNKALETMEQIK